MAVQVLYLASVGRRFQRNEAANEAPLSVHRRVTLSRSLRPACCLNLELSGCRWTLCLLLAALRLWYIQPVSVSERGSECTLNNDDAMAAAEEAGILGRWFLFQSRHLLLAVGMLLMRSPYLTEHASGVHLQVSVRGFFWDRNSLVVLRRRLWTKPDLLLRLLRRRRSAKCFFTCTVETGQMQTTVMRRDYIPSHRQAIMDTNPCSAFRQV